MKTTDTAQQRDDGKWALPSPDDRPGHRGWAVGIEAGGDPAFGIRTWDYVARRAPDADIELFPVCSCGWTGPALRLTPDQLAVARVAATAERRSPDPGVWDWMLRIENGGGGPRDRWIDHAVRVADTEKEGNL